MIKGLLAVDENLASSMALRFAARLTEILPLRLQAGHVEPLPTQQEIGSDRVRPIWKEGVVDAGHQAIQRLFNTEKVKCPFLGRPKVFVGNRDEVFLRELVNGAYDLFLEGYLDTGSARDFHRLITSPLYVESPCPILMVKNLVGGRHVALLCPDEDIEQRAAVFAAVRRLLAGDGFDFEFLSYRYEENHCAVFPEQSGTDSALCGAVSLIGAEGRSPARSRVICGPPEKVADLLQQYKLVVCPLPYANGPQLELLAHCPSPVLFCR
ncbi:MAG: hypothetical protein ACOY32_08320 [Thermodesulfobacteriota bacterium]